MKNTRDNQPVQNDTLINELHKILDYEMSKPDDEINFDLLKHCVNTLHELEGHDLPDKKELEERLLLIKNKGEPVRRSSRKFFTKIAVAACAIFVVGAANSISAKAFSFNFITTIIECGANFLGINFSKSDEVPLIKARELNAELKARFLHEGFAPILPTYFPQDMCITEFKVDNMLKLNTFDISLEAKDVRFKLYIIENKEGETPFQIPKGDSVQELIVGDLTMYIVEINKTYTAFFKHGNLTYQINMREIPYNEMIKTLQSMK